jgi:hypothetical protein
MDRSATIVTSRLTLLLFAGACVHSAPPVLSVQYTHRSAVADTAPSLRQPSDDAADVLGWPLLNRVTLPVGTRELRISDWYSMMAGTAVPIVRLIEQPGRAPEGQLVMVWHEARAWGPPRYRGGHCTDWKSDARRCAKVVRDTIDWPAAARRFGDLGAWDMTAPCVTRNEAITDAGDLYIRRLQGSRDDRYHCNAPSHRTDSEAGRAALALYDYYGSLVRRASPPPNPRRVHVEGGLGVASSTTAAHTFLVDRFVSTTFDLGETFGLGLEASWSTSSDEVCLVSLPRNCALDFPTIYGIAAPISFRFADRIEIAAGPGVYHRFLYTGDQGYTGGLDAHAALRLVSVGPIDVTASARPLITFGPRLYTGERIGLVSYTLGLRW